MGVSDTIPCDPFNEDCDTQVDENAAHKEHLRNPLVKQAHLKN